MITNITEDQFYTLGVMSLEFTPIFGFVPEEPLFMDSDTKSEEIIKKTIEVYNEGANSEIQINEDISRKMLERTRFFYANYGIALKFDSQTGKELELNPEKNEGFITCRSIWSFSGPGSGNLNPSTSYYFMTEDNEVIDYINTTSLSYYPKSHSKTIFDLNSIPNSSGTSSFLSACEAFIHWSNFAKTIYKLNVENSQDYVNDFKEIEMLIKDFNEKKTVAKKRGRPRKQKTTKGEDQK